MKGLMYFLLGFFVSIAFVLQSYADECGVSIPNVPSKVADKTYQLHSVGTFSGSSQQVVDAIMDYYNANLGLYPNGYNSTTGTTITYEGVAYVSTIRFFYDAGWAAHYIWGWSGVSCPVPSDTDGDGIPDECDFYPSDPTPYLIKLVSYQTVDGLSGSDQVRQVYQTDRGDYLSIGAAYDENKSDILSFSSPWVEPGNVGCDGNMGTAQQTTIEQPVFTGALPSGSAADHSADTNMDSGIESDGTETGDVALRGVIDNTAKTASNTAKSGDYLFEINQSLKNIDRNLAIAGDNAGSEESEVLVTDEMIAQAQSGETALNAFDPTGGLSGVSGELVQGVDYDSPGELNDETWVTNFIATNPIKTIFDNSGFEYTSASCTATLDLGDMGTHELSICALEDGFILFGQLLVGLTSLLGIIHLATGRGF